MPGAEVAGPRRIVAAENIYGNIAGQIGASQFAGMLAVTALGGVLSAALALAEAWVGIALSYLSDWPASFWIAKLRGRSI